MHGVPSTWPIPVNVNPLRKSFEEEFLTYRPRRGLWAIHDYLTEKRKEMDKKYDYRYSVLLLYLPDSCMKDG